MDAENANNPTPNNDISPAKPHNDSRKTELKKYPRPARGHDNQVYIYSLYLAGWRQSEIAEVVHLSVSAVATVIARMRLLYRKNPLVERYRPAGDNLIPKALKKIEQNLDDPKTDAMVAIRYLQGIGFFPNGNGTTINVGVNLTVEQLEQQRRDNLHKGLSRFKYINEPEGGVDN